MPQLSVLALPGLLCDERLWRQHAAAFAAELSLCRSCCGHLSTLERPHEGRHRPATIDA